MKKDIKSQFNRAKELYGELITEVKSNLQSKSISSKTLNLTQEIITKMRNTFDQSMYCFFEKEIKSTLNSDEIKKTKVYFPISNKKNGLYSILGIGKMYKVKKTHPKVFGYLDSIQPYNKNFSWLQDFVDLSNEKHVKLSPQKRIEQKRITVKRGNGSVSWDPNAVKFGDGVLIMGVPVNPKTQNVVPTTDAYVTKETWVSFMFENRNINSLEFCKKIIYEGEKILDDFFKLF